VSKYRESRDWQVREKGRRREWVDPALAAEAEIQRERQEAWDFEAEEVEWVWDEEAELFLPREIVDNKE
jgi:hypothetical protein